MQPLSAVALDSLGPHLYVPVLFQSATRGVSRRSRTLDWNAMDAAFSHDERRERGRLRRVVLAPRRWGQVLRTCDVGPDGSDTPSQRDDGGYQARHSGESTS
jgi:hypothetical protein